MYYYKYTYRKSGVLGPWAMLQVLYFLPVSKIEKNLFLNGLAPIIKTPGAKSKLL